MSTNGQENQKGRGFFLALFVVLGVLVFFLLKPYWGVLALALVVVGMIYGPVIMILFITTLDIYARYFSEPKEEPAVAGGNASDLESLSDTTE